MLAAPPIPISSPNASRIVVSGSVIPSPAIASSPTLGMFPINIRSTTLYSPFTIIPIMAGMEYFRNSLPTGCVNKMLSMVSPYSLFS